MRVGGRPGQRGREGGQDSPGGRIEKTADALPDRAVLRRGVVGGTGSREGPDWEQAGRKAGRGAGGKESGESSP